MSNPDKNKSFTDSTARVMHIIIGIIVFLFFLFFFQYIIDKPGSFIVKDFEQYTEVNVKMNYIDQYIVSGEINGFKVNFLIDTGATHVSIPKNIANKIGLSRFEKSTARTAGGNVDIFYTKLDVIKIGNIKLHNIKAIINEGINDNEVLLGMSALKKIDVEFQDQLLILKQEYSNDNT